MTMSSTSPGGPSVRCLHTGRAWPPSWAQPEQLRFLAGRMPGDDLLQDVIDADALAPGQMRPDAATQRRRARQVGAVRELGRKPPGDKFRGLAVEPDKAPPARAPHAPGSQQRGDPRGGEAMTVSTACPPRRSRRGRARSRPAAPTPAPPARGDRGRNCPCPAESTYCVMPQHPQRPDHGRPGDLELPGELMLTGQQRPGGYSPDSIRRRISSMTWAYFGGVYS